MKKIILIILSIILVGCSSTPKEITATSILNEKEIAEIVGFKPVIKEDNTRTCKQVVYSSEKPGENYPVIVKMYPETQKYSQEQLKTFFDKEKEKQKKYNALIETKNSETFIAYPSAYIYKNGYYVIITAGSGNDNMQKQLLEKLSETSIKHIKELTNDSDAEKNKDK